ncbi:hypothetical protein CRUP_024575 [Coryphaenoides rupestris]|nr:hypothetical protein CRUP_024575 [Coryphaenoides rupestris]
MERYGGACPELEQQRNDRLLWLWKESTAPVPLHLPGAGAARNPQARRFVRHRIQEAVRVSRLADPSYSTPIYAYIRPVFKDSVDTYMSEEDLVNTIGEAAALGAAGVISWGDMNVTDDEDSCVDAKLHLDSIMNPYIVNVSTAARLCSQALCGAAGRCVRKRWDSDSYLHLDPRRYTIYRPRRAGPLAVRGGLSQQDVAWFQQHFHCLCYSAAPCNNVTTFNSVTQEVYGHSDAIGLQLPAHYRLTLLAAAVLSVVVS